MSDYDPIFDDRFITEVALDNDGRLYALIYAKPDVEFNYEASDLTPLLHIFEVASHAIPLDDEFDTTDPHVRGPYDLNQLNRFYNESGLADVVTTYYDDEGAEYYVYINTD